MINVSFNELAIAKEHLATRTAYRPDEVSAFSDMLDQAKIRPGQPTAPQVPDRAIEPRDTQAGEPTAAAHDKEHAADAVATNNDKPEATSPVVSSHSDDSPQASTTVTDTADTKPSAKDAGVEDNSDKTATDDSQGVNLAAVVPLLPPIQKLADMSLNFETNTLITGAISPPAATPLPQGDSAGHSPAPGAMATGAATPIPQPSPSQPTELDRNMAAAQLKAGEIQLPAPSGLINPSVTIGNVKPETLFAVTSLTQVAMPTTDSLPLASPAQIIATTPSLTEMPKSALNAVVMATPSATALTEKFQPLDAVVTEASLARPEMLTPSSANTSTNMATSASQQPALNLIDLLDSETATITLTQSNEIALNKPLPALANGMVAQFGAVMSAEGQTKQANQANTTTIGLLDSLTVPNDNAIQTDIAVTAAATAPAIADQAQPKFTAMADGLTINTTAAAAGAHSKYAATAEAVGMAKAPLVTPPVVDQVVVNIAKAAAEGLDKINIKLKPASLGQIEVQLEIASDGRIHAVIAADKAETLDLLQRDARALERALGEAGLRTDSSSLSFNLRGQGGQADGSAQSFANFAGGNDEPNINDKLLMGEADRIGAYLNARAAAGGVDIRV